MRQKTFTGLAVLLLFALFVATGGERTAVHAQGGPCASGGATFLSRNTLRFAVGTDTHNATMPGQPTNFVTKAYRYRIAENTTVTNPSAPVNGWAFAIDIPRSQMALAPDTNDCYVSPVVTLSATVPVWKPLVSQVVALSERAPGDTNLMESMPTPLSDPFVLGLLRLTVVRNVAAP